MFFSIAVMVVSTALLLFYLQATCERILHRPFDQQYFRSVVSAFHLEFSSLRQASLHPEAVLMRLRVDFLKLNALMNDPKIKGCRSYGENLLLLYFRAILLLSAAGRALGLRPDKGVNKLAAILQYLANLVGERENALQGSPLTPSEYLLRV